jgi:hypothetical protein
MMGRPQRSGGARGGRKGTSLLDLRVLLVGMCVLSFVLTFLYVDDFDARASSDGRVTRQVAAPDGRLATMPRAGCARVAIEASALGLLRAEAATGRVMWTSTEQHTVEHRPNGLMHGRRCRSACHREDAIPPSAQGGRLGHVG